MSPCWAWLGAAWLLCGCLLIGCRDAPISEGALRPALSRDAAAPDGRAARVAQETPRAIARPLLGPVVKSLQGVVPGVTSGTRLTPGQPVQLPVGTELVLDFPRGARLRLLGPALIELASDRLDGLLCKEGVLTIDLAPSAPTPDSGFWLATPAGRLDLVRGGLLAVRAFPGGELATVLVSGSASLRRGDEPSATRVEALLSPGELLRVGETVVRSKSGSSTLEQALARVQGLTTRAPNGTNLDAILALQRDVVRAAIERERALVVAHRAALHGPDGGAMAAQAQLAGHAAQLSAQRSRLKTLLDRRAAARLGKESAASDALAEEARGLLGGAP